MNSIKIFIKKKILTSFNNPILKNKLSINLRDLDLSVRALNSLINQNINTINDLIEQTEGELKRFPNMGQKSIDEIKQMLDHYSLYLGMEILNVNNEANIETINSIEVTEENQLIELSEKKIIEIIKEFDETTLSVRSKNVLLNLDCTNIGDIISLSRQSLFDNNNLGKKSVDEIEKYINDLDLNFGDIIEPWDKDIVKQLRENLIGKISDEARQELIKKNQYLEVELKKILEECIKTSQKDQSIKDRIIDVLINRFGLDGSPAKTLEIIGKKYNVTRERIRQNQEFGLRKLRTRKPFTPILDKIFEELSKALPVTEIEFNRILKEKKFTLVEWDFKGLQDFYENLGIKTDFYVSKINNLRVITKVGIDNIFRQVMVNINKKISNTGLLSLSECLDFKEVYLNDLKRETIKKFIQTKPIFTWLDDEQEWFTFYAKRNRLSNLITKAATGSLSVDIDNLFKKIKNFHRLENVKYSRDIFISFCKKSFDCEIKDNEILFSSPKSKISDYDGYQGNVISPNEQKIVDIFNKFGPILNWWDLKELSTSANVKDDSLNMILQFSVLFQRIDRATYVLSSEKLNSNIEKKFVKIELTTTNFNKDSCPLVANKGQYYVEVYKSNKYIKTIAYPQTLRIIDEDDLGILYDNKVYPVINDL